MTAHDVIDALSGLAPGSPLALIRDRKPITREQAQTSYRALFEPAEAGDVSLQDRFAIATFVAGLHAEREATAFYAARVAEPLASAIKTEIERGRATGPYGAYPKGALSREDLPGPIYSAAETKTPGPRMAAALAHVHMLVFHPRDARPEALQALLDAGWSNAGIVTLSQLTAFLAFQIRAAAGLRTLAATPSASTGNAA